MATEMNGVPVNTSAKPVLTKVQAVAQAMWAMRDNPQPDGWHEVSLFLRHLRYGGYTVEEVR